MFAFSPSIISLSSSSPKSSSSEPPDKLHNNQHIIGRLIAMLLSSASTVFFAAQPALEMMLSCNTPFFGGNRRQFGDKTFSLAFPLIRSKCRRHQPPPPPPPPHPPPIPHLDHRNLQLHQNHQYHHQNHHQNHHHHYHDHHRRHHHRHYRHRCHHPFLFGFEPHFLSFVKLLFFFTFILLLGEVRSHMSSEGSNISSGTSIISINDRAEFGKNSKSDANSIGDIDKRRRNVLDTTANFNRNATPNVLEEYVCGSIDIRNSISQFKKLENCTVIEGSLRIVLLDNTTTRDFDDISFPKLREVTDYLLMFRIMGLQTLTKLFPNLTVIRGRELLHNYAFIIYEMLHLKDIGLPSLTDIVRGDVRIEKNPHLCYIVTVDWNRIARNYLIQANKDASTCSNCDESCPFVSARRIDGNSSSTVGDQSSRACWSADVCQKRVCLDCERLNRTCSNSGDCCPEQCIGGCAPELTNPTNVICYACKNFIYQNRCYDKCPRDTYMYFGRRCVTKDECEQLSTPGFTYKAFMDKCDSVCPVGYVENAQNKHTCDHCGGHCPKVCRSSVVSNVQSSQLLKGCTHINGSLEIYISSSGAEIVKELEENLKHLTEITDYLKIARSFPLISLNFLRNLKVIRGERLERNAYSIMVLDNQNLQDLWIFGNDTINNKKRIQVMNGRIFFHINPKLCYSKIKKLVNYVQFDNWTASTTWDERDVSKATNGDKVPCDVQPIQVWIWALEAVVVGINFEDFRTKMEDPRSLLGYLIYYRETNTRNVSIFDGRDACSNNDWNVIEFDVNDVEGTDSEPNGLNMTMNKEKNITTIIPNLKPYTLYALYIKTYTIASSTKGAQSEIKYFKTKAFTPSHPRSLFAKATKSHEIELKWETPSKPNGEITHYIVTATVRKIEANNRDYCSENLIKQDSRTPTSSTFPVEPAVNLWTNGSNAIASQGAKNAKNNNLPDKQQCCSCKKEKIQASNVEQMITFEDYIINTVYVKRTNTSEGLSDSPLNETSRRKRFASGNFTSNETFSGAMMPNVSYATESFWSAPNETDFTGESNDTSENSTTSEAKADNLVILHKKIYFHRELVIDNLEHYTEYMIEVKACQDEKVNTNSDACGVTAITSVRTLPLDGADDIDSKTISVMYDNSTDIQSKYKLVHIRWSEPPHPNGFIISYQLEHRRVTSEPPKQVNPPICVSREHYTQNSNGYSLELPPGNYTVRLRARSMANFGNWTEYLVIFIEEPESGGYGFTIVISCLTAIVVAITILSYVIRQNRKPTNYISVNPDYLTMGLGFEIDPLWEIPREKITLIQELGQGSFGMVYQGELIREKTVIKCAVKTLNDSKFLRQRQDFLKEAEIMKSFTDCTHVVKLLGIVSQPPVYVLMEIMSRGDLRKFLRDSRPESEDNPTQQPPDIHLMYKMAIQIADGMAYLASKKFVHRDLAARNCLISEDWTVKIGDFGMARDVYDTDYYRKGGRGLLPVRWMSPESLQDGIFTTHSDVWSYGVVLWEMSTLASQPYQGLSNEEVLKFVVEGGRMKQPEDCPPIFWNLMALSWEKRPKSRPTFLKIVELLLEHITEPEAFLKVSYYDQWRNDPERCAEKETYNGNGGDDSSTPLKLASNDDDEIDEKIGDKADTEQDTDVKFFPTRINEDDNDDGQNDASELPTTGDDDRKTIKMAESVPMFIGGPSSSSSSDNRPESGGGTRERTRSNSSNLLSLKMPFRNHSNNSNNNNDKQTAKASAAIGSASSGGSPLNNNHNLSTSRTNSESQASSNSESNLHTDRPEPMINFGSFDGSGGGSGGNSKLNRSKVATNSLLNGHLVNTSLV